MRAFYGSKISGHMIRTPEGYLVCKDVPIARTGTQEYRGMEFGGENPEKIYVVKRPEEEVFSKAALASFEGKPVVDEHPSEDVTPDNIGRYIKGTCRDVHRGEGALSDCVIADLIIYDKELIKKVENGKRDISCGYDCLWDPENDDTYVQREIRGNHVAVVEKGRAGHKVSIRDSRKGGKTMSEKSKNSIWGRMLSAFAHDSNTTPEDLEAAAKMKPASDEGNPAPTNPAPVVEKKEESKSTIDTELDERLKKIEDAIAALAESKKEKPVEESDALDALEEELKGEKEETNDEGDVEVDPKKINENQGEVDDEDVIEPESEEEAKAARDAALKAISALKPVVAALPQNQRKKAADSLADLIRGNIRDDGYDAIMKAKENGHKKAKDKAMDDRELGRMIRDKYNPHYKKN
nr:MAG TPA: hypothetical protein [Caudoviricetes sp.]